MENKEALFELAALVSSDRAIQIDREQGVIRGAKLHGSKSKNSREYADPAMKDLFKLYKNVPVRLGHDKRDWVDTIGSATATDLTADGIYGEVSLLQSHAQYSSIMEGAEKQPHLLKLSHEVPAKKYDAERRPDGVLLVKRVHKVDCLAIVTDGGVNQSLFEEADKEVDMEVKSAAELKEKYPSLYEEVAKAATDAQANNEKLIEALQQRDQATAKAADLEQRLAKIEEASLLEAKRKRITDKASSLKVVCDADLLEALMLLDADEKVDKILSGQPKLTEEGKDPPPAEEDPTPEQRGGLRKNGQPFSYLKSQRHSRLNNYVSKSN